MQRVDAKAWRALDEDETQEGDREPPAAFARVPEEQPEASPAQSRTTDATGVRCLLRAAELTKCSLPHAWHAIDTAHDTIA